MQKSEKSDGAEATVGVQFTDLPNALIACKVTEDVFNDQTLKVRMCVMVDQSNQPKQACITLQWFPTKQLKPIYVCVRACVRACGCVCVRSQAHVQSKDSITFHSSKELASF